MTIGTHGDVPPNFTVFMLHRVRHSAIGEPVRLPKAKRKFHIEVSGVFDGAELYFQSRDYKLKIATDSEGRFASEYGRTWRYVTHKPLCHPFDFTAVVNPSTDQIRAILRKAGTHTDISVVITL